MRWHDQYHVGDVVEARVVFADGASWEQATVAYKTKSGQLSVEIGRTQEPTYIYVIDRKTDIRPCALRATVVRVTPPAPADTLRAAIDFVEAHYPLPRCEHGSALRDRSGARLEPTCGCTEAALKLEC